MSSAERLRAIALKLVRFEPLTPEDAIEVIDCLHYVVEEIARLQQLIQSGVNILDSEGYADAATEFLTAAGIKSNYTPVASKRDPNAN